MGGGDLPEVTTGNLLRPRPAATIATKPTSALPARVHFHPQRGGDRALGIPQRSRRTNAAGAPEARSDLRRMGRAKRNPSPPHLGTDGTMGFASLHPSYGEKVSKS